MNSKDKSSEEKYFTSKLKLFWENCKKNWIWINLGAIITNTLFIWVLYYFNIMSLRYAIIGTIAPPLGIILIYNVKNIKNINILILMNKIMLVGVVGYIITIIIWLPSGYILVNASWAPLHNLLSPNLEIAFILLLMVAIYGIVAYILYRFGKKREWHISPHY